MTDDILARYKLAQDLVQGVLSKRLVLNDTIFPHWIGSSDCFWYARETREGKAYRLVDAKAACNNTAFDHQALADALERASGHAVDPRNLPLSIINITLSPRQVQFQAFDKHWIFESEKMSCEEIETTIVDGLCSPDGQKAAFVRNHNLWVRDLVCGEERALTGDGSANYPYATAAALFGSPSTPALQAVWSPDSQHLFSHQLDMRQVACRQIVRHIPQDSFIRPQLTKYKAAYPGDENIETYRLISINVESGKAQEANYGRLPLCRNGTGFFSEEKLGWWAKDSGRAFFVDMARGANAVRVVEFDTNTGATRILFEETSDTCVKLSHSIFECPLFLPLPGSDELIWFSERNGWGHLYLYNLNTGELKNSITGGKPSNDSGKDSLTNRTDKDWLVRDVLYFDTKKRELLVQTAAHDPNICPYYRDICRVNIDTGELTALVSTNYEHVVLSPDNFLVKVRNQLGIGNPDIRGVSPSGNYLITTRSRVDESPVSLLIDGEGKEVLVIESADPFGLPGDWQWPEPVTLKSADGLMDLYGVVYRPPGFSQDKRYPVLDFSSAHPAFSYVPHAAFINGPFCGEPYLLGAAYAALGFVVVAMEVPGMSYRHKAFRDQSYGCIASTNAFEDRIAGLRQLARQYPYMDLDRVGIIGCDGITGPVYGLLEYPDFYKVGVMVALEDARLGPVSMVEMFEATDRPPKTPYAEALVASLQGKLLLIHGMLDSITPPEATFLLIDALQQENKDFDMLLLPNDGHEISSYALRRTWDYLVTHLQGVKPPKAFKLTTTWDLLLEHCQ